MTTIKQMLAEELKKLEETESGLEWNRAHTVRHHFPAGQSTNEANYKYHTNVNHQTASGTIQDRYHTNSHDLAQSLHDKYKSTNASSMHRKYLDRGHITHTQRIDDERHLEEGAVADIKKWQHGNGVGRDHALAGQERKSPFEHGSSEDKGYHDGYDEHKHGKDREYHEYNRDLALRARNGAIGSGGSRRPWQHN